mgnify:CR=1 FL=1
MIELWLGVIFLTLLAIAFVSWPLLKMLRAPAAVEIDRAQENVGMFEQRLSELEQERDQGVLAADDFVALKLELEKNLLVDADPQVEEKSVNPKVRRGQLMVVFFICALVPAMSLGLYAQYGNSEELQWSLNKSESHQLPNGERPSAEQAIALLEEELVRNPANAEGWYMLAGAYMGTNQFEKGADSFAKVLEHLPEQSPQFASVVGQYAQALFFLENNVTQAVKAQVSRALAIDANEVVSLGLLGIEAFEAQKYQVAIDYWNKSLSHAQPNAADALRAGIEKAKQRMAELGLAVKESKNDKLKVVVDVEIDSQIKAQLAEDAIVFVFARPVDGRIPLAALKLRVSQLPKRVILDDSMAMMPSAKISLQKKVEVSARISLSGQPQAQKGDFQSAVIAVDVMQDASPIALFIDKVVE